jgi:hypothetical protein
VCSGERPPSRRPRSVSVIVTLTTVRQTVCEWMNEQHDVHRARLTDRLLYKAWRNNELNDATADVALLHCYAGSGIAQYVETIGQRRARRKQRLDYVREQAI